MLSSDIKKLSLQELRHKWQEAWGIEPHNRLGRAMLEKSLLYKLKEASSPYFAEHIKPKLDKLVATYRKNPESFTRKTLALKNGTRLVRTFNGVKHCVLVTSEGFEYNGQTYTTLSSIANHITGKHWNGWTFFGIKKPSPTSDKP